MSSIFRKNTLNIIYMYHKFQTKRAKQVDGRNFKKQQQKKRQTLPRDNHCQHLLECCFLIVFIRAHTSLNENVSLSDSQTMLTSWESHCMDLTFATLNLIFLLRKCKITLPWIFSTIFSIILWCCSWKMKPIWLFNQMSLTMLDWTKKYHIGSIVSEFSVSEWIWRKKNVVKSSAPPQNICIHIIVVFFRTS